jgi:hypothetical protein
MEPMKLAVVKASSCSPTARAHARQGTCICIWCSSLPVLSSQMRTVWSAEDVTRRLESRLTSQVQTVPLWPS